MTLRESSILMGGKHFCLNIAGRGILATFCPSRSQTLVDLNQELPLTFRRQYRRFGGGAFIAATLTIESLGRDVEVWAGRGLSATMEIGTDLAALLGIIP